MNLLYLDYNCFQRSFDDFRQIKIQLEALACQEIFYRAEKEKLRLVWSFMHKDETILCPFPERKIEVFRLSGLCKVKIGPKDKICEYARMVEQQVKISSKDALHLASAFYAKADFFLTCDDKLIKRAKRTKFDIGVTKLMNPIEYIQGSRLR